nr:MAG TPA: hypothetical protein [Caudoviricetes sp.]
MEERHFLWSWMKSFAMLLFADGRNTQGKKQRSYKERE